MKYNKKRISDQLTHRFNKPALMKGAAIFALTMAVQIIINRNTRRYSLSLIKSVLSLVFSTTISIACYKVLTVDSNEKEKENEKKINKEEREN